MPDACCLCGRGMFRRLGEQTCTRKGRRAHRDCLVKWRVDNPPKDLALLADAMTQWNALARDRAHERELVAGRNEWFREYVQA